MAPGTAQGNGIRLVARSLRATVIRRSRITAARSEIFLAKMPGGYVVPQSTRAAMPAHYRATGRSQFLSV
ncbi:MAG: hypothetical protein ACYCOU_26010 [Sulfobacillus sp.]